MPKCCEKCKHLTPNGGCKQYKVCAAWLKWFRNEWAVIRINAQKIKEQEQNEVKGDEE